MTSEEVLPNRDVLVQDGRFAAIEPTGTITVPADVEIRDGSGKYLIPGLMDLHIHLKFGEEIQPDMLYLYLANGVTTVLSMGGSNIVLDLRRRVAEGNLLGPRIFTTSPIIGNLSDRFGRRPVLLLSLLVLGVDYLIMWWAPTFAWLLLGRVVAGAAASTYSTCNAFIADISEPEKRAAEERPSPVTSITNCGSTGMMMPNPIESRSAVMNTKISACSAFITSP